MRRQTTNSKRRGPLNADQVREALVNRELNNVEMAQKLECSAESVRQIRAGLVYRTLHPELLRYKAKADVPPPVVDGPSCLDCSSWHGTRCGFDFPDPLLEGPGFAADCDLYQSDRQVQDLPASHSPCTQKPDRLAGPCTSPAEQ
jgi:hypothetical protein